MLKIQRNHMECTHQETILPKVRNNFNYNNILYAYEFLTFIHSVLHWQLRSILIAMHVIFPFFFNEIRANNTLYKFYDTNILRYYIIQLLYRTLYNQELCAFLILFRTRRYPFFFNSVKKNFFSFNSLYLSLSFSFLINVPCAVLEEIEIYTLTRLHRHNVSLLLFILTISTVRYLRGSDILVCHE